MTEPTVAETRGLWDWDWDWPDADDVQAGLDAAHDVAVNAAFSSLSAVFPMSPTWLVGMVDPDIKPNLAALAEGVVLGAFDTRPKTLDEALSTTGSVALRAIHTSSLVIVLTNGDDLVMGMGEGIIAEFTDLWDLLVKAFTWDTWAAMPGQIAQVLAVLCGERENARAVGFKIGQALAGSLKSTILGPADQFAHSLGKILGPILLEIAISILTAGVGLAGVAAKYGLKFGRIGLNLTDSVLDTLVAASKGRRVGPGPPKGLKEVATDRHAVLTGAAPAKADLPAPPPKPKKPDAVAKPAVKKPAPTPTPSAKKVAAKKAAAADPPKPLETTAPKTKPDPEPPKPDADRGLKMEQPAMTPAPDADLARRTTDAEAVKPRPKRGRRRHLNRVQLDNIADAADHYARTNPGIDGPSLARSIRSTARRFGTFDIDHAPSLRELAKLLSATRRSRTVKNQGGSLWSQKLGAVGELRMIGNINDAPTVGRISMIESKAGKRKKKPEAASAEGAKTKGKGKKKKGKKDTAKERKAKKKKQKEESSQSAKKTEPEVDDAPNRTPDLFVQSANGEFPDFDIEVTTYTQLKLLEIELPDGKKKKLPFSNERVRGLDEKGNRTKGTRKKVSKVDFNPYQVAAAFRRKIEHGQLKRKGGPGRGVIAVNSRTPPGKANFPEAELEKLRALMRKNPEVHELWLIGPGGEIVPVLKKPGSVLSDALQGATL